MSPSFDFSFGKPAGEGPGRWIEGSVVCARGGYRFTAGLWRRLSPSTVQSHPVRLDVDRPFSADDFAAYLQLVSTGRFETATRVLEFEKVQELDPAAASSITEAAAVWVDPSEHQGSPLQGDLTSLGEQLEQVTKRELLGLALSRVSF